MKTLLTLQLTIFLLVAVGFLMKKIHIIGPQGQKNINDLVIYLILPCNILHAFTQSAADGNFIKYLEILLISTGIQVFCVIYGKVMFRKDDINVFSMEPSARMRDFLEIRSQREFMAQKVWCLPVFI